MDLSTLKAAEDNGVRYKIAGETKDLVRLFRDNGCNYVRLRVFVNPPGNDGQVNTLAYTLAMARRVKQAGLPLLLDFHYSDYWCDRRNQAMPAEWIGLSRPQLVIRLHDYTLKTLKEFRLQGCTPDMVAIGNEISNGFLWPAGGPMTTDAMWPQILELLKAGVAGVRDFDPIGRTRVMIHLDRGDSSNISDWFFDHCRAANLDYDVIGLSFYPTSHKSMNDLRQNLRALANKFDKDIIVVETSYPFTGDHADMPDPATPDGQKQFLERLMQVVADTPNGRGRGVFYWEPGWIQSRKWDGPSWSDEWERRALFDTNGNALPAISAFWRPPDNSPYPAMPRPATTRSGTSAGGQ